MAVFPEGEYENAVTCWIRAAEPRGQAVSTRLEILRRRGSGTDRDRTPIGTGLTLLLYVSGHSRGGQHVSVPGMSPVRHCLAMR